MILQWGKSRKIDFYPVIIVNDDERGWRWREADGEEEGKLAGNVSSSWDRLRDRAKGSHSVLQKSFTKPSLIPTEKWDINNGTLSRIDSQVSKWLNESSVAYWNEWEFDSRLQETMGWIQGFKGAKCFVLLHRIYIVFVRLHHHFRRHHHHWRWCRLKWCQLFFLVIFVPFAFFTFSLSLLMEHQQAILGIPLSLLMPLTLCPPEPLPMSGPLKFTRRPTG